MKIDRFVIEGANLPDAMRLMKALFGEERSYATYKEMAEAAEKQAKALKEARWAFKLYQENANNLHAWGDFMFALHKALDIRPASSLKNEEVLDKDNKQE